MKEKDHKEEYRAGKNGSDGRRISNQATGWDRGGYGGR